MPVISKKRQAGLGRGTIIELSSNKCGESEEFGAAGPPARNRRLAKVHNRIGKARARGRRCGFGTPRPPRAAVAVDRPLAERTAKITSSTNERLINLDSEMSSAVVVVGEGAVVADTGRATRWPRRWRRRNGGAVVVVVWRGRLVL